MTGVATEGVSQPKAWPEPPGVGLVTMWLAERGQIFFPMRHEQRRALAAQEFDLGRPVQVVEPI